MQGWNANVEIKETYSVDGTNIRYYLIGEQNAGLPVLVFAPGLGTMISSWKNQFEHLVDRFLIISWEERGTYSSGTPTEPGRLGIENHGDDLEAIVAAEKLNRFGLGGWSMGVMISLEYYRRHPEQVECMFLVNGAPGDVFKSAFNFPGSERLLRGLLSFLIKVGPAANYMVPWLLQQSWVPSVLRAANIVTNNFDDFVEIIKEFVALDFETYFIMMSQTDEFDGTDLLDLVTAPTLITAGTKDAMTPVSTAEMMHDRIAGSTLKLIDNGTHYSIIEYPEVVNEIFDDFLTPIYAKKRKQPAKQSAAKKADARKTTPKKAAPKKSAAKPTGAKPTGARKKTAAGSKKKPPAGKSTNRATGK